MQKLKVYTDGGCSGNPGPGGWAFIISNGTDKLSRSGIDPATTNNKMELTAVISALEFISASDEYKKQLVEIYTDSQYVKKGITEWIHSWERNGWRTASRTPVKNKEHWIKLKSYADRMLINWHWVMGHAGDPLNEECDRLVQEGIKGMR